MKTQFSFRLLAVHFCLFVSLPSIVSGSDKLSGLVLATSQAKAVSVNIVREADYVATSLTILVQEKDPKVIKDATNIIIKQAEKHPLLKVHKGAVSVSAADKTKSVSSMNRHLAVQIATLQLLIPFSENIGLHEAAAEFTRFAEIVRPSLPGKETSLMMEKPHLAVDNPAQYRNQLLKKFSEETKEIYKQIGKGKMIISGLESPVLVKEIDDRFVELYIDYSMSFEFSVESRIF